MGNTVSDIESITVDYGSILGYSVYGVGSLGGIVYIVISGDPPLLPANDIGSFTYVSDIGTFGAELTLEEFETAGIDITAPSVVSELEISSILALDAGTATADQ